LKKAVLNFAFLGSNTVTIPEFTSANLIATEASGEIVLL
jgi:hypothetical protein